MNTTVRKRTLTAAMLVSTAFSGPAMAALVQYTYTGNAFTDTYRSPGLSDVGEIGVNIGFTVEESLLPKNGRAVLVAPNYSSSAIPFRFYFSLGQFYKIDDIDFARETDNSGVDPHFQTYTVKDMRIEFDTDADGHLSGNWNAFLNKHEFGRPGLLGGVSISSVANGLNSVDSAELVYSFTGSVTGNPGTWVRQLAPVPLPASGLLFGFAIAGLGVGRRLMGRE